MATLGSDVNSQTNLDLLNFTQGIELDKPLAASEVRVQKAWAQALTKAGFLTSDELQSLDKTLDEALKLILNNQFNWRVEDEDIHMNLERFMGEKAGILAKKIHLGRSRNDLIATTLRLFVQKNNQDLQVLVQGLIKALVYRAEQDIDIIVPGLTHLQFGQPIRFSQVYLSHAWGLKRDLARLQFASDLAMESMPLGSAALGGTHINIDLNMIAQTLGFKSAPLNSYDSVGDRDFMLQSLQAYAMTAIHLSRLAEDTIIWSSQPYQFISLPKAWSTGSSIMPNKRNPDIPELIRAKSAQVIGAEQSANLLLKGLVSSYSSDLHELKRVYLQALPALGDSLKVFPEFIKGLTPNPQKIKEHLNRGHLLATEVANQFTEQGKPFREAYQEVAALCAKADSEGKQIHELGFDIGFEQTVEKRANLGGTAKASVLAQIKQLQN